MTTNTGLHVVKLWIFLVLGIEGTQKQKNAIELGRPDSYRELVAEDGVRFHSMCGKRAILANKSLILLLQGIWCSPVMENISQWAGVGSDSGQRSELGRPFRRMFTIGFVYG